MDLDERRRLEEIAERFDAADDYDRYYQRFFGTLVAAEVRAKDVLELGCSSGVMSAIRRPRSLREHPQRWTVMHY